MVESTDDLNHNKGGVFNDDVELSDVVDLFTGMYQDNDNGGLLLQDMCF